MSCRAKDQHSINQLSCVMNSTEKTKSKEIKKMENDYSVSEKDLIVVTQLPVIEEQLRAIKDQLIQRTEAAQSLVCTEESLQTVKKERAALTKLFNLLEDKRKEAKKAILAPYEAFEKVYRECVNDVYAPCDKELAARIREIEDELKARKRSEAEDYFKEYCFFKQIDWLSFDRIGLKITLNSSKKSLHDGIKAFVDNVSDEIALIDTQDHSAEILVEYKKTLNVANAITTVVNRHKAIDEERRRMDEAKAAETAKAETVARVDAAVEEMTAVSLPEAITVEEDPEKSSAKTYEVSFTVRGTLVQIKALKNFLNEGEYDYGQQ